MPQKIAMIRHNFYHIGENVELYTHDFGNEPYLISIEDNVVVASNVKFINHDVSCFRVARYLGIDRNEVDKVGPIILKENCFVGSFSILMPNITVGRNSIIGAGSVVTKNVPDNEVWGGAPAVFIMSVDEYAKHVTERCKDWPWIKEKNIMKKEKLITARQKYFFKDLPY